ncbi:MAG: hypothetical protein JW699_02195 [Chitinispirillaceae bacterium]|nr:hypothetical protein [Chitinispirillaceae bacterium]
MNQNSKVGGECFSENVRLFGNQQTEPEQFNLYNGLRVMSETLVSLAQVVDNVERQCNMISQQLRQIDRKIEEQSRSR